MAFFGFCRCCREGTEESRTVDVVAEQSNTEVAPQKVLEEAVPENVADDGPPEEVKEEAIDDAPAEEVLPQNEDTIIEVVFKPGTVGMKGYDTGLITKVVDASQAHEKGVKEGMNIISIDGETFASFQQIKDKANGDKEYKLTLKAVDAGSKTSDIGAGMAEDKNKSSGDTSAALGSEDGAIRDTIEWAIREDSNKSIAALSSAIEPPRVWIRESLQRWLDLGVGDACEGEAFFKTAEPMISVYPWIFNTKSAVKYLTKDFNNQLVVAREKWPPGAKTLREAVQAERKAIGIEGIEKAYWNTCTVRILWIYRALTIFVLVLQDLSITSKTPVECAQRALDAVLSPYLSWYLTKIGAWVVWQCVYGSRDKLFRSLNVPENEVKTHLGVVSKCIRRHTDALEKMLKEEVPSVVNKRC